jgi:DNA-binding transcriptional LysR family regulator
MNTGDLRYLHSFLTLAQELHFGRAADRLFITQPALSQQIARLEKSLGARLFLRDQRQLALTAAGRVFREGAARITGELEELAQRTLAAAGAEDLQLTIGVVEYASLPVLSAAMLRLQERWPGVRLTRQERHYVDHGEALATRQIDVGLGILLAGPKPLMGMPDGVSSVTLLASNWRLLLAHDQPLVRRARPGPESLDGERLILFARDVNPPVYDGLQQAWQRAGAKPHIVFETAQAHFGIQLAEQGLGAMLGTGYVLASPRPGMATVPVDGLPPLEIIASWRTGEERPLVLAFLALLHEESRRLDAIEAAALKVAGCAGDAPAGES